MMATVYAEHASKEFNIRMGNVLERITAETREALGNNLVALLLGGGYGRGEGGVNMVDDHEIPYNDIDFALIVKNKYLLPHNKLLKISEKYANEIKIHVDFSRPLTTGDIKQWPRWLVWQDLLNGYKTLTGPINILESYAPQELKYPLPIIEAVKLLLNRGAGLLWSLRVARDIDTGDGPDFIRRNYYKCALALGDSLLIAHKRHTTCYKGRDKNLAKLITDLPELKEFALLPIYETALRFKFSPHAVPGDELDEQQLVIMAELWGSIFLYIESLRTGQKWNTAAEYCRWRGIREVDENTPSKWPRNLIRNVQLGKTSLNYPREYLYQSLPHLLGLTDKVFDNWDSESGIFLYVWKRFN